jgi:hypothetical protein
MKFKNRIAFLGIAAMALALGMALFSAGAAAQNEGWWIVRAEYGTRAQHNDVTDILKDLISRGGVNGRVMVNNQTMGGDPAVGADKTLRIFARNARNEEQEFSYKEGSFVPVEFFIVRRGGGDWDDRPTGYGGPDQRDGGLRIIRAYYGVQGRTVDVTEFLRSRVRGDSVSLPVNNRMFGGDPAIGAEKVLIVVYRYKGVETAAAVREGNVLTLP